MTSNRKRAGLALIAALSTAAGAARAQTPEVEAMMRHGLAMRRNGRDRDAFAAFEAAWNLSHSPRARAQMGLAAQALGRWADADQFLREALAAAGDPWVVERRAVLDRSLSEIDAHLGLLELRCNVDGAAVRIDGAARGTTPLAEPLRLPSGTVTIQLSAPGHLEVTRQATLAVGQTTREQVDLVARPRPTDPITPPPAEAGPPPVVRSVDPPPRRPPPEDPPSPGAARRALAWTTAGVALAGVVMGAVALGQRNAEADAFNARNENADPGDDCQFGSTAEVCVEAEATVATRGSLATAGFVLGGAAAVASVVLFATLPSRRSPASAGFRGCTVGGGRDGAGASCEIAF